MATAKSEVVLTITYEEAQFLATLLYERSDFEDETIASDIYDALQNVGFDHDDDAFVLAKWVQK